MGWIYERDGHRLVEDDLTTGEWEHLYLLVNRLGLPHTELEIHPLHCPTCRSAIAIQAALAAGVPTIEAAAGMLVDLPRGALPNAFTFVGPPSAEPQEIPQPVEQADGAGVAVAV